MSNAQFTLGSQVTLKPGEKSIEATVRGSGVVHPGKNYRVCTVWDAGLLGLEGASGLFDAEHFEIVQ